MSYLKSWSRSLQLYKLISEVAPAGTIIIGVRDSASKKTKIFER